MTLKELAEVIPGYCNLLVHTETDEFAGKVSQGDFKNNPNLAEAFVVKALPISSYVMEITIEFNHTDNIA